MPASLRATAVTPAGTVRRTLLRLFVDDTQFAGAIGAWLAAVWLVVPHLDLPPALAALILFAGLAAILIFGAVRQARARRAAHPEHTTVMETSTSSFFETRGLEGPRSMKRLSTIAIATLVAPYAALAQTGAPQPGWSSAGNGLANTRASAAEHVLGTSTVAGLAPVWTLKTTGEVPDTPSVEGSAVYVVDSGGSVWRVDAATGTPVWSVKLPAISGNPMSLSRTSPAIAPNAIIIGDQAEPSVYALSKTDGSLLWRIKLERVQHALITSSPVVAGNRVIVGVASSQEESAAVIKGFVPTFRGSVAALDLATGAVQWQFYTVPREFSGGAVWGSNPAVDTARDAVYVGTGDNYSVPASVSACQVKARNGAEQDKCLPGDDRIDSVISLNLATGKVNWSRRMTTLDTWTVSCLPSAHKAATPCPQPQGLDYDFGSAPNLFSTTGSTPQDLVGAGQKSGVYWAFDRDTGKLAWATQVNPGGTRGGIQWGSAVDGGRVFVAASNANYTFAQLTGGTITNGGFWSALDANTGKIVWQTPTTEKQKPLGNPASRTINPPKGALARAEGSVSAANGVMYGADASGVFVALDEATGARLWSYDAGGAAVDGPSIVSGMLFWGDGYADIGPTSKNLIAFGLKQ